MSIQGFGDPFKASAALDVPLNHSQEGAQSRTGLRELVHSRFVEQLTNLVLVLAIKLRTAQIFKSAEASELTHKMLIVGVGIFGGRGSHRLKVGSSGPCETLTRTDSG